MDLVMKAEKNWPQVAMQRYSSHSFSSFQNAAILEQHMCDFYRAAAMQARSSYEHLSVCLSVCLSNALYDKTK